MSQRIWTEADIALAAQVYGEHMRGRGTQKLAFAVVARRLDRTHNAVSSRFYSCGPSFAAPVRRPTVAESPTVTPRTTHHQVQLLRIDPTLVADRDRRSLLEPQSLTAMLMGDPLPGRSALDRRRAGRPEIVR